jgi:hypothetical protein
MRANLAQILAASRNRLVNTSVTALSLLVREDGVEQVTPAEIRPQCVGHPDLRVCDLPQQKIARGRRSSTRC